MKFNVNKYRYTPAMRHTDFAYLIYKEEKSNISRINNQIKKFAYNLTDGFCYLCGEELKEGYTQLDHIKPAAKFNVIEMGNAAFSCVECNRAKDIHDVIDYYDSRIEENESVYFENRDKFVEFINLMGELYKSNNTLFANTTSDELEALSEKEYREFFNYCLDTTKNAYSFTSSKYSTIILTKEERLFKDYLLEKCDLAESTKAEYKASINKLFVYLKEIGQPFKKNTIMNLTSIDLDSIESLYKQKDNKKGTNTRFYKNYIRPILEEIKAI